MTSIEPLTPPYFGLVAEWLSNAGINQWLTSEWRDRAVDPIVIGIATRNRRNKFFLVRCGDEPCGLTALADLDTFDRVAMVWYALGVAAFAGRGVITEALRQMAGLAFNELKILALHAWIMEDNVRSRRVLEKTGFREAGRLRAATLHCDRRVDRVYFDLTPSDPLGVLPHSA